MLDFFRQVAQTIPTSPTPNTPAPSRNDTDPANSTGANSTRDMLQDRAGIIVLREDLDFYAIPPKAEIEPTEMIEVKRAAARALLKQNGIFSGLRRSEEQGTTEQHLIEMLTAGYVLRPVHFYPRLCGGNSSFYQDAIRLGTCANITPKWFLPQRHMGPPRS